MQRSLTLALISLFACDPAGDRDSIPDTGDSTTGDTTPQPAELRELSSGECPLLEATGTTTTTFQSSDEERKVSVVLPEEPVEGMPVVFFFHGLLDTSIEPTSYHADALGLQAVADDQQVIFVLPESRTMSEFGFTFYMWQVMDEDDHDLVLFDDLRSCMATEHGADMSRLSAMGFSGGGLFTTVLARERGDALATIVEMSGGSDVEFSLASEDPIAAYGTPANTMPALLFSGGDEDGWPQGFVMVDFQAATDNLQAALATDEHYVWRCRHDQGHTITMSEWGLAKAWALAHSFGQPSPYEGDSIDDYASWCEIVTAE